MDRKIISGIQQIGIGVTDAHQSWKWYRDQFQMDIEIFEEEATAELMLKHTDNKPIPRLAILTMNIQGGGGYEIWQQTKFTPKSPDFELKAGDLGIYVCKQKCRDVSKFFEQCKSRNLILLSDIVKDLKGDYTFYLSDPYGNIFQIVESNDWYKKKDFLCGGSFGSIIGVSDIDAALSVYKDILNHEEVVYDETGYFEDLNGLPGGNSKFRRVLLRNIEPRKGAYGKLLGSSEIELIQVLDREPVKIFRDRIWGDLGYIHLCFDIRRMDVLKDECSSKGFAFTVDSSDSFDMGVAAGRFAYIEDPDGTLIEFVETHKLPIIQKLGWYMNLEGRKQEKHLPDWMINTISWKRKRD